jgi:hypothetical protein
VNFTETGSGVISLPRARSPKLWEHCASAEVELSIAIRSLLPAFFFNYVIKISVLCSIPALTFSDDGDVGFWGFHSVAYEDFYLLEYNAI